MTNNRQNVQNDKARYIGLDFGSKTIGVALGCPDSRVATGLTTIFRDKEEALRPGINQLREIIKEYGITHIVLGNPVNMDGSISLRTEKTLAFRDKLQRNFKSINITLWDERLSTQAVTRAFFSDSRGGAKKQEAYRAHVDEMAAVYILQGFLETLAGFTNKHMEEIMENEPIMDENMGEIIIMTDDDGGEYPLHVLASREAENNTYLLAALMEEDDDEETSEVLHFKLIDTDSSDPNGDISLDLVDEEHSDFALVMELFKADYEELGITIDEEDSFFGA